MVVAAACPTKPIIDILRPSERGFKTRPDLSWWSHNWKCTRWWIETMTVQCSSADCNGSQFFADQIPKKTGRKIWKIFVRDPLKKICPRKKTRPNLITSVSLSNDCTAGDLQEDLSSPWMRALMKIHGSKYFLYIAPKLPQDFFRQFLFNISIKISFLCTQDPNANMQCNYTRRAPL